MSAEEVSAHGQSPAPAHVKELEVRRKARCRALRAITGFDVVADGRIGSRVRRARFHVCAGTERVGAGIERGVYRYVCSSKISAVETEVVKGVDAVL